MHTLNSESQWQLKTLDKRKLTIETLYLLTQKKKKNNYLLFIKTIGTTTKIVEYIYIYTFFFFNVGLRHILTSTPTSENITFFFSYSLK